MQDTDGVKILKALRNIYELWMSLSACWSLLANNRRPTSSKRFAAGFRLRYPLISPFGIHSLTMHSSNNVVLMPTNAVMFGCDNRLHNTASLQKS